MKRPELLHPRTGEKLRPIFVSRKTGRVYWPILGAEDPDPDKEPDDKDDDPDEEPDDGKEGSEGESGDAALRDELKRLKEQRSNADKRATAAEAKLKELEDKDKSDLEKAKAALADLEKEKGELLSRQRELTLNQALLAHHEYGASKWQDPEDILEKLQKAVVKEDVSIEEDGTIKGLDSWLKKLAKEKEYLLKKEAPEGDEGKGASGGGVGSGKKGSGDKLDEAALVKKFSALRR